MRMYSPAASRRSIGTYRLRSIHHARRIMPTIRALRAEGLSLSRTAAALNEAGKRTVQGRLWTGQNVVNIGRKYAHLP